MVANYNHELDRFLTANPKLSGSAVQRTAIAKTFVTVRDDTKFSWHDEDFQKLARGQRWTNKDTQIGTGLYRPFHRRAVNAGRVQNKRVYQLPKVFPHALSENLMICTSSVGARSPYSVLMTKNTPDVTLWIDNTPGFPMRIYPLGRDESVDSLFSTNDGVSQSWEHNVRDQCLLEYIQLDSNIGKDDIFYYVYGILHSREYREVFADDLKKSLPRIPKVSSAEGFWSFSKAGRELSRLHTEYETVEPWAQLVIDKRSSFQEAPNFFRVEKMSYGKTKGAKGRAGLDLSTIAFNEHITISGIPLRAHEYMLGSRSALDWILESFQIKKHKESGIVNDPNDWATEHNDPTYIFDLVRRVVTVSMQTLDIVESLPSLNLG
jgi:predicted helicase